MTSKVCKKQCAGKTVDRFRLQWNNYKERDRKFLRGEETKQNYLHEHFLRVGHQGFEEVVSICLVDKTVPSDLDNRQYYWMRTLKTIATFGLNIEETYRVVYTITRLPSDFLVYIIVKSIQI